MSDAVDGPGAALKDAREALDVTTREVADALNLPVSVVEAMEANDYERLPQPVFTRGYLRSYARLLELDPAAIVARYPIAAEAGFETGEQELVTPEPAPSLPTEKKVLVALGGLVLALLLVVWLLPGDEVTEAPVQAAREASATEASATEASTTEASATETSAQEAAAMEAASKEASAAEVAVAEVAAAEATAARAAASARVQQEAAAGTPAAAQTRAVAEPASDDGSRGAAALAPAREPVDTAPVERRAASSREAAEAAAPSETLAAGTRAAEPDTAPPTPDAAAASTLEAPTPAGFRRITAFGDDELVLTFAEDCWVQVRNLDGENLYGDLNRAGGTLRLIGRAPFRVRLGYAPGATLTLNGEDVALTRFTRNNVANVVVGR